MTHRKKVNGRSRRAWTPCCSLHVMKWGSVSYRPSASPSHEASSQVPATMPIPANYDYLSSSLCVTYI